MAILKPESEDRLLAAWNIDPDTATDAQSRVAAQTLAKEALTAQTIAEMPDDQFRSDEEKTAAASKIVELMTGEKDFDGRLWNGGNGFKTGAEYLRSVKETLTRGTSAAADPDLQAWMRMSDAQKDALVESERGILSHVGEAAGFIGGKFGELVRGVPQLSKDEYASAPEDVREASDAMGSVMWDNVPEEERAGYEAKVRDWRDGEWQRLKRRGEYEAKLRRKNALLYLPDMIKSLQSDDAKGLAGELAQNPSEMPANWTDRLKRLPTRDIETLAQIRGMTREHVEGGFLNWLGDMGIAAYNGAHGILSGMGAQEAKIAAMAMGWDGERVNEMINRKHALWSAYAGWSSPVAQLSDEHGAVANFTIGLASAVPFIASMHLKGLGYVACATEMMSEADAQAAAAGIDTTNPAYIARNAVAGGLYAYMLKAVSPRFLGASANGAEEEMALRTAFMKGVMSGVAKLDTMKVMSQRTASGALMMAMQQGIAAVNEDLNLGGDAWRDAAQRFTETFVSSIPDMLAFSAHGVLAGHARASGGLRKMFTEEGRANRSQNLREAVENAFAVRTAVDGNERIDALRTNTTLAQIAAMRRAWTEGGERGLARLGFRPEEIAEAKDFFDAERKALGAAEKLDALDRATDAESLEEIAEDAPLAERNDAARRFDEANGEYTRAVERLAETLRGKTADAAGVVGDLEAVRNVWAQGNAVGAGRSDGTDAGAAALVKAGFSPEDAAELSKAFGAERRGMYSPAATEALRGLYTRSTRGRVEATAALEGAFGGRVRTVEGRTYIDLPMPDGGTGTLAVETVDLSQKFYGEAGSDPELARQVERATGGAVKADDWIRMDDAARRRAVKKHRLVDEGDFVVTDPADPSLHVSSGDAETVFGTIRIDPSADPGAAFHEAMHGFLRFCQETGFFDEADLKWLTDTYGKPQNAREQLNEEAAADGFRNYLAKRMAGAITDEPSAFRKLFGLIGRLRHLREARAATERLATNAEEALYDAFLAGRYRHIHDLNFAEPTAPKAEAGGASAAPQTGAPLDKSAPTEEKSVRQQSPKTQGQSATVNESGATSEKLVQPTAPRVVSFEALTPTGGKKVKGHYEIVPLASLLHSNKPGYPMELQQRDRRDNKGEEQTREEHVANFEAGYLLADPKTDSGAMVVARRPASAEATAGEPGQPQLVVVSGNGRTMVLEELAKRHLYDRYRNRMKEWAAENGVENAVADAANPVLVRVVDELGGATLKELADLSNTNAIQQMNEEETARADADLVRSLDLARLYRPNMDGSANMAAGASDEFFRAFVRATGDTSLLNSDGSFTEALRMRARRALLAIACGQGARGRDVVKKLVEDTDALGIDRQKDAAAAIAPHVAAAEARPEYAIGPDVSRAFADYIEFRENRGTGKKWGTLENYLKQGDMLDPRSEIAEAVMRLLDDPKGAPVLAETVRLYAEAAKGETDGLFGAARTRAEIWRDAAKTVDEKAAQERARDEAAFKPETRFSIRSEADGKKDEGKKKPTDHRPLSESDQTPPVQFFGGATSITLTRERADPVKKFGDSISQDGVKSPAGFLTGLVHALGSTETNPDKTQYFDITHEDGKTLSLRVANHRATAAQYKEHGNTAAVKTSIVVKMSDKAFKADADVDMTEYVYFADEKKLTAEREAGIARAVAEWIGTGEWNGPAADQVNMSPRKRKSGARGRSFNGVTPEQDAAYAEAVKRGDLETARRMEREVYERMGYSDDSSYQGTSAFNGAAPSRNAYFETKEERIDAAKREEFEDTSTLGDYRDGIDVNGFGFIVFDPRSERNADEKRKEAIRNIRGVLDSGAKTITMYRSVPADVKETQFRNGDWITPSRAYAEENAQIHGWGDKFRVIEQEVSVEDVWWDGNDIAEWGFDDGKGSVYKNTAANRKLTGPTYDDAGNLIPLSKRFNDWKNDARYSIAGRKGAENMGIKGAAEAEAMEKAGADREDIWRKTGWWRGRDGKWRVEIPDVSLKDEVAIRNAIGGVHENITRLGELVDAPELFKAYPDLRNVRMVFTEHEDLSGALAAYAPKTNTIEVYGKGLVGVYDMDKHTRDKYDTAVLKVRDDEFLNNWLSNSDAFGLKHGTFEEEREYAKYQIKRIKRQVEDENDRRIRSLADNRGLEYSFKANLIHEIQHAIQRLEGFSRGSSPQMEAESRAPGETATGRYHRVAGEVEARNATRRANMTAEERAATPPWATEDVPVDRQIVRYSVTAQTETPQFKNFFGDWEKDPENASKVVDKDGKPLVVYHGSRTGANIKIFNTPSFFSDNRDVADMFKKEADFILRVNDKEVAIDNITARQIADELTRGDFTPDEMSDWGSFEQLIGDIEDNGKGYGGRDVIADALASVDIHIPLDEITEMSFKRVPDIYECYINIRRPLEIDFKGKTWGQEGTREMEAAVRDAAKNGYDGVIVRNIREGGLLGELRNGEEPPLSTDYIPVSPTQIKSATDNTGAFDPSNPDIRYSIVSLAGRDVAVAESEPLTTREAQDETKVREVLMPIVGQEFPQLGEAKLVKIDGNFPDYFWSSNTSQNLRRVDKLWRAKVSAVPILGDILKTTPLGPQEAAEHLKNHPSFKDRAVFYRCSTEFGIKRHDGVAVYPCDLLVMEMTDNGQRYVYDIVRMKKPTLTAMADLSAETLSQLYERHLTGESATSAPEGTANNIPKPSDEIKADPEAFARRSVVARATEGETEEKESALVAFVAERALRHGPRPNAIKTVARLGLEMGLKMVDTKRIITKGEALAERVRGTVIEHAVRNGDVATATAMLARESDIDRLVAGAAGEGGKLVRSGEGKIKSILDREIEKTVRSFNAASLADVERDTGIDIAGEILANSPEKFDPSASAKATADKKGAETEVGDEGSAPGDTSPGDGNLTDYEIARRQRVRKEAEERVAKMIATAKERSEAAKKEREEWEAKRDERKRRAEETAASGEDGGGESSEGGGEGAMPSDRLKLSTFADFKTPEEFAAFFRVWAEDRYKKEHGASTLGKHEEKRLFPEFYRKAVVRELQDLADKLLPPKGARATVNRWLGEIQPGVRPDTLERVSADVFAYINRNAIRESRTAQIQKFRNSLKPFVKGTEFDDLKLDADRKVTGWVEEAARYIRRVCNLSIRSINGEPSQLDQERERLQAILDRREKVYDDEGKNTADAPKFDMETRRALAKLQLLEKYGSMKRYMPGEIADLADEAMRWLQDEAGKLEAAWKDAREAEESIRGALTAGIVGPNGQKYKRAEGVKGWADKLFDSMNGMIRLRLQHLVRFADSKSQQKARDAINRVVVMLGDGETAFARHLQDDRMAFHNALNTIFTDRATGRFDRRACADWLNRMTEAIPADLSRRLSTQGYADSMTYGQMLQLLVSLEQKSYAEAVRANKRDGQADLIRTFETVGPDGRRERVLSDKDIMFIDWLRSFYEAKRGMLSEVTKRMTGLPVDSPDPLYCPVKMYMGDQARGMHVDSSAAWDPIGAVFSRRMANVVRDFDESASILGQFFDRSAASANLVAWGERGSIIRGVFTDGAVQQSIRLAFGGGELTKILRQLEETFNGGENIKKAPGEIAAADKAMNWMTYLSLGYNPLSAAKQTTSFTVWANALPGGFKDLWRYMTDVDMATIRHIKESEEFKVRYGNEVGSGHDVASKGLFENPSENPVAAFFRKTSMGLLRKGDFLPGGWIAQGVFRDLYNRHLKEGMDADAADRLAMTETFNMLEETQQSGRTYNTSELAREHGRLGRLLVQFATSPLQQLQYETQAAREVWDLKRYRPTTPDADFEKRYTEAKGKLIRAAVINHVLLPAALHAVTSLYRLAMGYDPEWEQEGWHWTLLRDITLGQFSRVFFIGAISSVTTDALITGKPIRDVPALIPAEGVVKLFGNITVTARDVATLNYDRIQKDFDRLLKSTSITRTPYDILRLATGTAYAERDERREKRRKKTLSR